MKSFKEFIIDGEVSLKLLYELKVVGEPDKDSIMVALHDTIFLFKESQLETYKQKLLDKIKLIFPDYNELKFKFVNNLRELSSVINDTLEDVFIGYIDSDKKLHFLNTLPRDFRVNSLSKKIVDTLRRKEYIDKFEFINEPDTSPIKENEKVVVYHGTNSDKIIDIVRKGLLTGKESEWEDLNIKDRIFLTKDIKQALFHANRVSSLNDNTDTFKVLPVVLKLSLPDKNKLDVDYDSERMVGGNKTYGITNNKRTTINIDSMKVSRELGIYSYKGNIYPNHIVGVFVPSIKHIKGRHKRKSFNNEFDLSELTEISRNQVEEYIKEF